MINKIGRELLEGVAFESEIDQCCLINPMALQDFQVWEVTDGM